MPPTPFFTLPTSPLFLRRDLITRHFFNYLAHVLLQQVVKRRAYTMLLSVALELLHSMRNIFDLRPLWQHVSRHYYPLQRLLTSLGMYVDAPAPSPAILSTSPMASSPLLRGDEMAFGRGGGGGGAGSRMSGELHRWSTSRGGASRSSIIYEHDDDESYFKEDEKPLGPLVPAGARTSAHAPMLLPPHHQTAAASDFDF